MMTKKARECISKLARCLEAAAMGAFESGARAESGAIMIH
jgi:hypothetical protein